MKNISYINLDKECVETVDEYFFDLVDKPTPYYKPELNYSDLTLVKVCVGIVQEQGVLIPELQARLSIILEAFKKAEIEYKENN